MLNFNDLKRIVSLSSKSTISGSIADRFSFTIDYAKVEKNLAKTDPNFHILGFGSTESSHKPTIENDLISVMNYIKDGDEYDTIFNGDTEIVTFLIYAAVSKNEDGSFSQISLQNTDGKELTQSELFDALNSATPNGDLAKEIIKSLPVYQVLVYRYFNTSKDAFAYKVWFKSNYEMVGFHNYEKSLHPETEEK